MRKIKRVDKFNKNLKQLSKNHPDIDASITGTLDDISRKGLEKTDNLIPGLGGHTVYKRRLGLGNKGKKGGVRLIFYFTEDILIALFVYAKGSKEDVPPKEIAEALQSVELPPQDLGK